MRTTQPVGHPAPSSNHTDVVRLKVAAALCAGWVIGWCWCQWGLDWVAGMTALLLPVVAIAAGLREAWRRSHDRRHEFDEITTRHRVARLLSEDGR